MKFAVRPFLVVFAAAALYAAEPEKPGAAAFDAAIQQLSNDDFTIRESASNALIKMSDDIAPALEAALPKAADAETTSRIQKILAGWPAGKVMWTFEAGFVFGLPVVADGRVYVGNKDMNFFCLDGETGKEIWKTPIGGMMFASPALSDGRVYVIRTRKDGSPDGTILCLSAKDGSQLWTWHGDDTQNFTAPMISDGRLFFGSEEKLICIDAVKGKTLWEYSSPQTILAPPSIAEGKVLIGGLLDHALYCLSADSGKLLWNLNLGDSIPFGAAISGNRVFAGTHGGDVLCLELDSGKKLWAVSAGLRVAAAPAVAKDRVYVGSESALHCLNASTGAKLWQLDTGGTIYTSPAVSGNCVYVLSINNKLTLRCLNAADGKEHWTFETKESGYATPVLCGRRLYVGYHSVFYCLRTGFPGPKSWPMTGGNPARTNCNDE